MIFFLSFFQSNSPRRGRAAKRLVSDIDALPEDEPTQDSGTSSLESPKKPLSTRYNVKVTRPACFPSQSK